MMFLSIRIILPTRNPPRKIFLKKVYTLLKLIGSNSRRTANQHHHGYVILREASFLYYCRYLVSVSLSFIIILFSPFSFFFSFPLRLCVSLYFSSSSLRGLVRPFFFANPGQQKLRREEGLRKTDSR